MSVYVPNSIGQYFERRQNKLAIATEFGLLARRDSDPRFIAQVKRLDEAMKGLPFKVGSNLAKRLGRKVLKPAAAKYRALWLAERPKRPTNVVRKDIARAIVHSADVRAGLVVATTGVKVNRAKRARLAGPLNKLYWKTQEKMAAQFTRADFEREFANAIEEVFESECRKHGIKVKG